MTLCLGCIWASGTFDQQRSHLVRWIVAGQVVAGALDFVENTAMLQTLEILETGGDPGALPAIAADCAGLKFALVGAGILTILAGAAASLRRNR